MDTHNDKEKQIPRSQESGQYEGDVHHHRQESGSCNIIIKTNCHQ